MIIFIIIIIIWLLLFHNYYYLIIIDTILIIIIIIHLINRMLCPVIMNWLSSLPHKLQKPLQGYTHIKFIYIE